MPSKGPESEGATAEFLGIGKKYKYSYENGKLVLSTENTRSHEVRREVIKKFDEYGLGYIDIGAGTTLKFPSAIEDLESYFRNAESQIENFQRMLEAGKEEDKHWTRNCMDRMAFHLRGFAEQAGMNGDAASKDRALKLADSIMPEAEYAAVLEKRLTPEGRLKITKEDIG